jgi:hypothetical protein
MILKCISSMAFFFYQFYSQTQNVDGALPLLSKLELNEQLNCSLTFIHVREKLRSADTIRIINNKQRSKQYE